MVLNSKFPAGWWSQIKNPRLEDVALICPLKGSQKPAFRFRECWSIGVLASGSETLRLGESNVMELKEKSLKSGKLLKRFLSWASCVQYSGRSFFQHSTTPPLRAKQNTGRAIFSDPAPRTGFLDLNKVGLRDHVFFVCFSREFTLYPAFL